VEMLRLEQQLQHVLAEGGDAPIRSSKQQAA
jgi:hypothetical protein